MGKRRPDGVWVCQESRYVVDKQQHVDTVQYTYLEVL